METVDDIIELVAAVSGERELDLVICDVQLVNVHSSEIQPTSLGVFRGRIVSPSVNRQSTAKQIIDGKGYFALPGLIDTHVHVDSTLLTPSALAELIVPHGTTAVFADPMEIANVAGMAGLEAFVKSAGELPYHFYVEVPSRVPSAPGLETTGGSLGFADTKKMLSWKMTISLGELDPSKVLGKLPEYLMKVVEAQAAGKIANGHTAGLSGEDLAAYACACIADDHECISYDEARERLALGMAILVREGSTERNLEALVGGLVRAKADTRHWMMCTDDKHPDDIAREGHIDHMLRKAISIGLKPVRAIQMATINAATHFRLEHNIGSLTPGRWADIILTKNLTDLRPDKVFFKGELVAEGGRMTRAIHPSPFPNWLRQTVKITHGRQAEDFHLHEDGSSVDAWLIKIFPDQIVNKREIITLEVVDGYVRADFERDVLKLAVVERYGKNGNIGITFVNGFNLKMGALASSVSHDHHNIVVVGADDASMACCVRAIERQQGGLVACKGEEVLAELPLPIGGLMSDHKAGWVIEALQKMNQAAYDLGCRLPAPFMSLSFISLPTVPELGLTDMGLVDVHEHRIIAPFLHPKKMAR
ncbi:MAG: adenine deaminase [Anaerolineales bacterium]|nr:adenine deaminase [Anaerolineae bacterium]PWB53941.1 MAG: adenine deaminase [Anaerolineales bacterium]